METREFFIKKNVFDRERQLIISPDFLQFDDSVWADADSTKFLKNEIVAFRYGVKWLRFELTYGSDLCIDIKSEDGRVIKIRLKVLFGIRKNAIFEKYSSILNLLFEYYFDPISRKYLNMLEQGEKFNLCGITFSEAGIQFDKSTQELVAWEDVGTKTYTTYFAVFSKKQSKQFITSNYFDDWNTAILYGVSREVLKGKGFLSE